MSELDDPARLEALDASRMLDRIAAFPEQCAAAWSNLDGLRLPAAYRDIDRIVALGVGGSAIGADLIRTLTLDELPVPFVVHRDYGLPASVNARTLIVGSSYSGNTEETLDGLRGAAARGARIVAISTGGALAGLAGEYDAVLITYQYQAQPRAALGYAMLSLLRVLQELGLVSAQDPSVAEAVQVLAEVRRECGPEMPEGQNPAKELARALKDRLPFVYGSGILAEVARRWKGQFNENAKAWGTFDHMPELNHNTVVGYQYPAALAELSFVVMLRSSREHPRNAARFAATVELLDRHGIAHRSVNARGETALAQMLSSIYLGDWVSYYLAILYGVDPTPIDAIGYLKGQLAALDANSTPPA